MNLKKYVVDPNGTDCYGKYSATSQPDHIPISELEAVSDLSDYDVIEWRYEDF